MTTMQASPQVPHQAAAATAAATAEDTIVTVCRIILPFARECRLGVWFGFVGAALLPAVGTCVVLAFGAMPGRCCFLRVTQF